MLDPPKGYMVACNNKFATDNFNYQAASTCGHNTARASRADSMIKQKLDAKEKFSVEFMKEMQLDVHDHFVIRILPQL